MQIYLVGGAVRDELLGLEVRERDWVVVGARPEDLTALGYRAVGRDFPVFLHPQTNEEYALARTERKSGPGYRGFVMNASPDVTLEQDLERRDLTINAIAKDIDSGKLVDPYGGQRDLDARVLRHVSNAFIEDPVRVLRIARFASRFAHLGFTVAPETLQLMRDIAASGELRCVWCRTCGKNRTRVGPARAAGFLSSAARWRSTQTYFSRSRRVVRHTATRQVASGNRYRRAYDDGVGTSREINRRHRRSLCCADARLGQGAHAKRKTAESSRPRSRERKSVGAIVRAPACTERLS